MAIHAQTIQIFLPSGDPQGVRVAALTTRIVQTVEIPRARLDAFLEMPEANQVGIYFLFGENEETGQPKAYIGQTGNLGSRLKKHNEEKDFWNRAVVAVSLTHSLTVTHAYFLEWLAIKQATDAKRYELDNQTIGTYPHTPAPMKAECNEVFETIDVLLTTLGYPAFEPLITARSTLPDAETLALPENTKPTSSAALNLQLYCTTSDADGRGQYTDLGFVIQKGSTGNLATTATYQGGKKRQALIDQGIIAIEGERIVFTQDYLASSPSFASSCLAGCPTSGWGAWHDVNGTSLGFITGRFTQKETEQ